MRYEDAPDLRQQALDIIRRLGMSHVQLENVSFFRSYGTSSRRTIARCHTIGKLIQKALGRGAIYVLEFIHERFDNLDAEDKTKTIIHELMHIPKAFGGGFKHHDYVCEREIEKLYNLYKHHSY